MTTISVQTPVKVPAPRVTALAASVFVQVLSWFQRSSEVRAERRAQATRQSEAAAVREYALRYASHDPRFVADLMAAADRHERT